MQKKFSIKRLFLALPIIYIIFGWYIGLSLGQKPVIFGPYEDIPVIVQSSLLGSTIKDISGGSSIVMVVPQEEANQDPTSFKVNGYFVLPDTWDFEFPAKYGKYLEFRGKLFPMTGSYSQAIAHEFKNPSRRLGSLSVEELNDYLKTTGKGKDTLKLMPYLFIARLEEKYPWLYSDTVFVSRAMGNVFKDNFIPYDILGLVGILVLCFALPLRKIWLWLYYLLWVFSYWLGRIGYHDPSLSLTNEGWEAIRWSFWNGFILKEGRIFLVIAFVVAIIGFTAIAIIYLIKHVLPRTGRELEDFLKIEKDVEKRKELYIEKVEFKTIHYNINKKLNQHVKTDKYFLGVSDDNKDILVNEAMLNHHLHVLGPTGSGKTSLVILPLSKQAIEKNRGCCFIDFKGDEVFKRYVQQKAKERGKKFYYFSIDPNEPSVSYNPLFSGDIHSKVDRIMTALELIYQGPAGFYSNIQSMAFVELLKGIVQNKKEVNFTTVKNLLKNQHFLRRIDASSQEVKGLLAAISWISGLKIITENELDLHEVIKNGDIVFFALKSQINTRLAEAIGRMLIIDLKSQAAGRKETDPPYFIFIDEFQNLACSHFIDVISKVRSANFCLILSNQSRGNLSTVSKAFENAIFTNTATKIIFMQEDPVDARFWSDKTGQTLYEDKTIFQIDNVSTNREGIKVDGLRSAQGNIRATRKNYISENIFLRLPFRKSIVFARGRLTAIANHEFLFDREERDRLISLPFCNIAKEEI